MKPIPAAWRDTILFLVGLSLLFHEAVIRSGPERYGLLVVYSGMLGLPLILRGDERAVAPSASPPLPSSPPSLPSPGSSGPPPPPGEVTP